MHNKVLQRTDVDDIYMEILHYLYTCDDYNITKAQERSSNAGVIVSLEGYVHSCIKYCVIRFCTEQYKKDSMTVREQTKDEEGKELSLFDTIPDTNAGSDNYSKINYELDEICKAYENQRYAYGPDIFQIWFIRLQTMMHNKKDKYKDILAVLGVSKKDIAFVEKESSDDGAMMSIAKAITLIGIEESSKILKKYVYSAKRIEDVIKIF